MTFLKQEYFYRRDSPSVPLEFPKLANAQPSNFGPLRIFFVIFEELEKREKKLSFE